MASLAGTAVVGRPFARESPLCQLTPGSGLSSCPAPGARGLLYLEPTHFQVVRGMRVGPARSGEPG